VDEVAGAAQLELLFDDVADGLVGGVGGLEQAAETDAVDVRVEGVGLGAAAAAGGVGLDTVGELVGADEGVVELEQALRTAGLGFGHFYAGNRPNLKGSGFEHRLRPFVWSKGVPGP